MTALSGVDSALVQQALVVGNVVNSLTLEAVDELLTVDVAVRYPGEINFREFPVAVNIQSAGYFSIAGSPTRLLPTDLNPADTLDIRFTVMAKKFSTLEETVAVSASSLSVVEEDLELAEHSVSVSLINAPILQHTLALIPLPVDLSGVVIEDNDPAQPLANVSVQVILPVMFPVVITDARGRYRTESLPVTESVTLQVIQGGEPAVEIVHVIDYSSPSNIRIISLNG